MSGIVQSDLEFPGDKPETQFQDYATKQRELPTTLVQPARIYESAEEAELYRRVDWRIMPILAVLYLLSFMDRGNIGNAKIQGLQKDLAMSDKEYNLALTIYFIPYCVFEVPANLVLKKLRPSTWLATICVAWGIVMTLMGVIHNKHGLYATRFFLGLAEAGLYPGVILYLGIWYPKYMFQTRAAIFFGSATVAGSFSGLLAFAIAKMNGVGGYEGWRWIFILEGLLTVVVGIASYFIIVDFPHEAKFLSEEERAWIVWKQQSNASVYGEAEHFSAHFVKKALVNWQTLINSFSHFCAIVALYGVTLFMPTIIKGFGKWTVPQAQLLTIPVYFVAGVWVVSCGIWADKIHKRYIFIVFNFVLVIFGYTLNISPAPKGVKYAGLFFAASGAYAVQPNLIAWLSNNMSGQTKRGVAVAFEIGMSNFGGIVPSNIYFTKDAPHYYMQNGVIMGCVVAAICTSSLYAILLKRENMKRSKYLESDAYEREQMTQEEIQEMGDLHPTYRYTI